MFVTKTRDDDVSIRSRLFGREKRAGAAKDGSASLFQSAPGFLAGRNMRPGASPARAGSFNPLPAFWPGETTIDDVGHYTQEVSIRSRLFGREKHDSSDSRATNGMFQSAPGFLAGRNMSLRAPTKGK